MATTADQSVDPLPPLKPGERHPQLEVDVFCVTCGYNLHGQPVTRDDRLGIFICRCPECGGFHPAGTGLTATKPWLNRLATAFLVLWVFFVLFVTFWIGMAMGVVSEAHIEGFSYRKLVTMNGQPAEWKDLTGQGNWQVVQKGTTQPAGYHVVYTREKQFQGGIPWMGSIAYDMNFLSWRGRLLILSGGICIGLLAGMLLAIFLWHWSRRGYAWALLFPFVVAGVLLLILWLNDDYTEIILWVAQIVLGYAALQAICVAIGLKMGRPIARTFLCMFIPPRPRQHFTFLWRADGKPMPPVSERMVT